jgi:hypothetical protein
MLTWLAQNKEWVFSGAGIAAFGVLWWLLKKLSATSPVASAVTQAPQVTISPTFNLSQSAATPETSQKQSPAVAPLRSVVEAEEGRPKLYTLPPRICFVHDEDSYLFTEGGNLARAVVATFRMAKPSADRRGTHITARLSFRTTSVVGLREKSNEIARVNYGTWIGEEFNSVTFALTDTKELILVMGANGKFVAIQDNRHGVSKFNEPSYYELEPDTFFVDVTLVDEIYGSLITYTYEVETNPLKVSEIIRIPPASY